MTFTTSTSTRRPSRASRAGGRAAVSARRRLGSLLALGFIAATTLFVVAAGEALAGTVTDERPLLFSFDGSDTSLGGFDTPASIDLDSAGNVYVVNTAGAGKGPGAFDDRRAICKFNPAGQAQNFAATGTSCLDGSDTPGGAFGVDGFFCGGGGCTNDDVAVDNTAVNPGRIHVAESGGPVHAFDPDGSYLWTLPRSAVVACGLAVAPDGHLWVISSQTTGHDNDAHEFAATGSPPAQLGSFPLTFQAGRSGCFPAVDQSGDDLYIAQSSTNLPQKYVNGSFDSDFSNRVSREITLDQTSPSGHIFTVQDESFTEFDAAETELGNFGGQVLGQSTGIAYNPVLDRVYVSDRASDTVKVFGPITSGPVPDVAISATTDVTRTTATAHGTVNPQGLANSYHFQWAVGGEEVQHLKVNATSGTFKIEIGFSSGQFTDPLPFNISPEALEAELEGLAAIGAGNVSVSGTPADGQQTLGEYDIAFTGALAGVDVNQLFSKNIDLAGTVEPGSGIPYTTIQTTAPGPVWGTAQSSLPQSLPADSSDHPVSFAISGLNQNTAYSVRLVATNTDNSLAAYSAPDTFTTLSPPPPTVSIDSVAPITIDSAHIEATIDPQEDTTTWRVQKSTDPTCAGGFVNEPLQTIPTPGPGPVSVDWDLTGLEPGQTYCLRLTATNSGGTDTADEVFQTLAVAPTDADAAFAAPRTDTTARLNARVNPQGEADLTYRFEWSTDGGSTWTALPDRVFTDEARTPIVVADELTGLEPDTTYHFRLAAASNSAGSASGLPGEELTFSTRTTAETLLPERGIELVNNPDKGNQNAYAGHNLFLNDRHSGPPISPDGDQVFWVVSGGAPGAPNGANNSFLAKRTADGWRSESLAPPAAEQLGGGREYQLAASTSDFETYIFNAARSTALAAPSPPTFLRVHQDHSQQLLKAYTVPPINPGYQTELELTDDGEHVVFPDNQSGQLEDIGSGSPEVVSLMPGGSPSACGLDITSGSIFHPGRQPGYNQIATTDASRVYFQVPPDGNCTGPRGLYLRNRDAAQTTLIDPGTLGNSPEIIRATPDGRQAYFLTRSNLDPADANLHADVYRWDEGIGASSCLTCEAAADANVLEGVLEGVLVSDDFSHLYFLSRETLAPGAVDGGVNLYALGGGAINFVGAVQNDALNQPQLSADGNVLLFTANASRALTADLFAPQCGGGCRQLYRYDDRDQSVECVSCRHGGATMHRVGVSDAGSAGPVFMLSGDGGTAAFATQEALLPLDVNQDTDIYEWRGGSLRLISDGLSDSQTGFTAPAVWGLDYDGSDIFFGLVPPGGSLTGFERDGLLNLYDARIGGGFIPPSPPAHCTEDSCQGPLQSAPALQEPGTSTYSGPGNARPQAKKPRKPRCARKRGKAKRRCVRKRRGAARANHNKGGNR